MMGHGVSQFGERNNIGGLFAEAKRSNKFNKKLIDSIKYSKRCLKVPNGDSFVNE